MSNKPRRFTTQAKGAGLRNTFILLSAGPGRRMTCYGPKCLLEHKSDKTILDSQIEVIRSFDTQADIILVAGFEARKIIARNDPRVRIIENPFYEETGAAESLRLGVNASLPSNVYFIHGDIIFSHATLVFPDKDSAGLFVDSSDRIEKTEVGVGLNEEKVVNLSYGLPEKWGQIGYVPQQHYYTLRRVCNTADKTCAVFEVLNSLLNRIDFVAYRNNKCVLREIDSVRDL